MHAFYVREYGHITVLPPGGTPRQQADGICISQSDFTLLKHMTVTDPSHPDSSVMLFRPCFKNGGEALQVQNYVGVISLPSGNSIEILPKICMADTVDSITLTRSILLRMLVTLDNSPFKIFEKASLATSTMPLWEIFMSYFLREVGLLIRRGLCSDYMPEEGNQFFLRGKLLLREHIRHNSMVKDRFYVRYDTFEPNRPENRLVKTALQLVSRRTRLGENTRLCRLHLKAFECVPESTNITADFAACRRDRNLAHYSLALTWCRMLLNQQTPLPQTGTVPSVSLMFPMEKLFEKYVATKLREKLAADGWHVREQARQQYLVEFHDGSPFYTLCPDLLLSRDGVRVVADTKWKRIANAQDIKRSGDLYQLFAYGEKYSPGPSRISFLIYPMTEYFSRPLPAFHFRKDAAILHAVPYDLVTDSCPIEYLISRDHTPA